MVQSPAMANTIGDTPSYFSPALIDIVSNWLQRPANIVGPKMAPGLVIIDHVGTHFEQKLERFLRR